MPVTASPSLTGARLRPEFGHQCIGIIGVVFGGVAHQQILTVFITATTDVCHALGRTFAADKARATLRRYGGESVGTRRPALSTLHTGRGVPLG
jgi:hypothetical protein